MTNEARIRLRAALIALGILVHGFAALPIPRSARRSSLDLPVAHDEIVLWSKFLTSWGFPIEPKALADDSFAVASGASDFRRAVMAPFNGWFRVSGTGQGWGLFTYPDSWPNQLRVDVRRKPNGKWEPLYAGLDPDLVWMRGRFVYRRVRGVYDGNSYKPGPSFENFVDWVADEAFAQFPDVREVRVSFMRLHTVLPGEDPGVPQRRLTRIRKPEAEVEVSRSGATEGANEGASERGTAGAGAGAGAGGDDAAPSGDDGRAADADPGDAPEDASRGNP
jgi:hypothetical protein